MKAISLWQPYATLIAAGYKRIETRSWKPHGLREGQLAAIRLVLRRLVTAGESRVTAHWCGA